VGYYEHLTESQLLNPDRRGLKIHEAIPEWYQEYLDSITFEMHDLSLSDYDDGDDSHDNLFVENERALDMLEPYLEATL